MKDHFLLHICDEGLMFATLDINCAPADFQAKDILNEPSRLDRNSTERSSICYHAIFDILDSVVTSNFSKEIIFNKLTSETPFHYFSNEGSKCKIKVENSNQLCYWLKFDILDQMELFKSSSVTRNNKYQSKSTIWFLMLLITKNSPKLFPIASKIVSTIYMT